MRSFHVLAAALVWCVLQTRPVLGLLTSSLGPVVDLGYAAFAGNATLPNVQFFGGIPYAEPPIGNLRFRAPKPIDESGTAEFVTDARNWGPLCLQQPAVMGIGSEGEQSFYFVIRRSDRAMFVQIAYLLISGSLLELKLATIYQWLYTSMSVKLNCDAITIYVLPFRVVAITTT